MSEIPKGYKQTELGIIPVDWVTIPMSQLLDFKNGLNKEKSFFGKGTPIVNYMDVFKNFGLSISHIKGKVTVSVDETRNYHVKQGDVFFTRTSETIEEIGMSSVMLEKIQNAVFSGFVLRGRPKNDILNLHFKKYCFRSEVVRQQITSTSSYTTRALTNGRLLSKVLLPIPPAKTEQEAIAGVLSDTDALIESQEKLISKKRLVKQGAMRELLRPKEGWTVKTLGAIGIFSKGAGIKKDESLSGPHPCIRYGEIYTRHNYFIKEYYSYISNEVAKTSKRLKKGDILFAGSGETKEEIAKCVAFIEDTETYAGGDIVILSPQNVDSLFLGYYLNTAAIIQQKASKGQGDAVVHISANNLKSIIINLPSYEEQTKVAAILSDMDAEISALEAKLSKYKQIKQGMAQKLLTGRIRLV